MTVRARGLMSSAVLGLAALLVFSAPAAATDVCKAPLSANGGVVTGWKPSMAAARTAWERKAARTHGARFANWWYSGDRTIECTWDDRGITYRCRATAIPCG
jgi:hypothetical protein